MPDHVQVSASPAPAAASRPRRLGAIVIGQSPRADIHKLLQDAVGAAVEVELRGCLDGLSRAEIDRLTPKDSGDTMFTKLPDGSGVRFGKHHILDRAQALVDRFAAEGTVATVMCCTGVFPSLTPRGVMVFPSAVLANLGQALLPEGRLGRFLPLADQLQGGPVKKWDRPGLEVVAHALIPTADAAETAAAADRMAAERPDLVVMDCISYTPVQRAIMRERIGAPVLLAIGVTAAVVREMLG
ncbi:MAG: AroM family protein [Alphaproteobacteria bacterium]